MKIALIGANGQLGSDLAKVLPTHGHDLAPLTHADVEVTDAESVAAMMQRHEPEMVLNMAAFHKVDVCEEEVEQTFAVNVYGVRNLALACRAHGA
ncbi:MAG: sugar nucleotide-binding protein, partial [Chloroflexota bacterium]|nr:sugar nucleotide-binding protein [Chloroflexota bacterium]